jgi:hypothetical protein
VLPLLYHSKHPCLPSSDTTLFPGDRIYVHSDCLICIDNWLAKVLSPIERLLGVTLLTNFTIQSFRRNSGNNNNNPGFGFIAPL